MILVYGWTIYWSLWKLPSWLDFLPLGEIGAIFSYLLATNLIESLLVLLGIIVVCLILPQKWFREVFVSRGSVLAASVLISIMIFEYHFVKPADYFHMLPIYLPLIFFSRAFWLFWQDGFASYAKGLRSLLRMRSFFFIYCASQSLILDCCYNSNAFYRMNWIMAYISRRDFLRLAAMAPVAMAFSQTIAPSPLGANSPNIIVLVFDAMSADNLSLYGYRRNTRPNLERLAQRSTVYHSHYSAGSFTTSGTASLLTGLYPWTHRAINQEGQVGPAFVDKNIFSLLGKSYDRAGFGQNVWAELLLGEFHSDLDVHLPPGAFSVRDQLSGSLLEKDAPIGYYAYDDFLDRLGDPPQFAGIWLARPGVVWISFEIHVHGPIIRLIFRIPIITRFTTDWRMYLTVFWDKSNGWNSHIWRISICGRPMLRMRRARIFCVFPKIDGIRPRSRCTLWVTKPRLKI